MAVTFTYSGFAADTPVPQFGTPYTGGTTPPTALQTLQVNRVNALISFTDTDTTINFTHTFGNSNIAVGTGSGRTISITARKPGKPGN